MDAFDKLCAELVSAPAPAVAHWCELCTAIAASPTLVVHAPWCRGEAEVWEVLQFDEVARRQRRVIAGEKAVARWRGASYFLFSSTRDATRSYRRGTRTGWRRAYDYDSDYDNDDLYFASDGQFW